jgi:hypothetical protein
VGDSLGSGSFGRRRAGQAAMGLLTSLLLCMACVSECAWAQSSRARWCVKNHSHALVDATQVNTIFQQSFGANQVGFSVCGHSGLTLRQVPGLFGMAVGVFLLLAVVGMLFNQAANESADRRVQRDAAREHLDELEK